MRNVATFEVALVGHVPPRKCLVCCVAKDVSDFCCGPRVERAFFRMSMFIQGICIFSAVETTEFIGHLVE